MGLKNANHILPVKVLPEIAKNHLCHHLTLYAAI